MAVFVVSFVNSQNFHYVDRLLLTFQCFPIAVNFFKLLEVRIIFQISLFLTVLKSAACWVLVIKFYVGLNHT
jgi:hypothetical protein